MPSPHDLTPEDVVARFPPRRAPDVATVHEWLRRGKLRGYKAGHYWYVTPQALDEFCAEQAADGAEHQPASRSHRRRSRAASEAAKRAATAEAKRLFGTGV